MELLRQINIPLTPLRTYNTKTIVKHSNVLLFEPVAKIKIIDAASKVGNSQLVLELFQIFKDQGDDVKLPFLIIISCASMDRNSVMVDALFSKVAELGISPQMVVSAVMKNAAYTFSEEMLDLVVKWAEIYKVHIDYDVVMKELMVNSVGSSAGTAFMRKLKWMKINKSVNAITQIIFGLVRQ